MSQEFMAEFWRAAMFVLEAVPGDAYDNKIEFVANVLGIAGFVMSLGLLIFGPLTRRGRRRPATQGDLERLSSAVVEMIGERIVAQLADSAPDNFQNAPVLVQRQIGHTKDRVLSDLSTAVGLVANDHSVHGEAAAAALIQGEPGPAEDLFKQRSGELALSDPMTSAEYLHLHAVLRSTHDLEGALSACLKAINIDPANALGWSRIAHLYLRMGRTGDARLAFERALALENLEGIAGSGQMGRLAASQDADNLAA